MSRPIENNPLRSFIRICRANLAVDGEVAFTEEDLRAAAKRLAEKLERLRPQSGIMAVPAAGSLAVSEVMT